MYVPYGPVVTGVTTLFVLASAATFAIDPNRSSREAGVERTVPLADLCGAAGCSIAYKSADDGVPSRVVPAR